MCLRWREGSVEREDIKSTRCRDTMVPELTGPLVVATRARWRVGSTSDTSDEGEDGENMGLSKSKDECEEGAGESGVIWVKVGSVFGGGFV